MELPADVLIHNELLGLKGSQGKLITISPHGFYEMTLPFKSSTHRLLLPVATTVVIFRQPEPEFEPGVEIER